MQGRFVFLFKMTSLSGRDIHTIRKIMVGLGALKLLSTEIAIFDSISYINM
jgi:hypothetical protein